MARYNTSAPTTEGRYRAVIDTDFVTTTDWFDLSSENFISLGTGQALQDGLTFTSLTVIAASGNECYLKYRPRDGANDPIDANSGVVTVWVSFFDNPLNLLDSDLKTISIKKTNATDSVVIFAGFDI